MAESSTPEEMLSSDESSGEVRVHIPAHNLILYVTEARVLRVEFPSCQSWPHETSWTCCPTPNLSLNTPKLRAQLGELKKRWESRGEHLTSIRSGSLIFVFGHDTEDEAIQMAARHLKIKEAILLFLHEIGSQVKNISMEAVVQEAKRTAKKQQKESGQIITGMDGDSTAIHSNVSGTQNVQEMHQELGNIHIRGDVSVNINVNCDGGTHETSWHINPAPDKHISQVSMESFHRLGRWISEFCLATLRRVTRGCLIFSFAHSTSEDAIDMIVKHRKVKEVFLDFVQELDPSIEDIRIEVVLRELSVSEEQTTQITETRPGGMADPEHKDEEGASRSHPQQKDDDETSHPHILESGDNSSSLSHSPQTKDEDTCVPHPQKTEEDKTSLQQTDEDTSHQHPQKTEEDETPLQHTDDYTSHLHPQQVYVKSKHQTTGIEKGSGSHSSGYSSESHSSGYSSESHLSGYSSESHLSGYSSESHLSGYISGSHSSVYTSSDPSQGHSRSERGPRLSTASHATPSQADRDLYYASVVGNLEEVKRLLTTPGINVNCRVGGECWTPVMEAAVWGHGEVVKLLVSKGADVSLVDENGNNILHHACWGGDVETVEFLLPLNVADINSRGQESMTPVMWAAYKGQRDMVELLVSEGADVSLVDEYGNNILQVACMGGAVETVEFVLSLNKVDIDARNQGGLTAADVARRSGHKPVVELLVSRDAQ